MTLTSSGAFKFPKLLPSEAITFSNRTPFLHGEDKRLIEIVSKMLRWLPEDRLTAKELYNDPWLAFRPEVDQKRIGRARSGPQKVEAVGIVLSLGRR